MSAPVSVALNGNHTSGSLWTEVVIGRNNPDYPGQKDNYVRTHRYTILTFIPLTLLENYRILTNVYFLIVLIFSILPTSPVNFLFTLVPILVVLLVSMIKAGVEDYFKYRHDQIRNKAPVKIFKNGKWVDSISRDIKAGDIVMFVDDQMILCDLLYITSSNERQTANFSVSELNGETSVHTILPHRSFKGKSFPECINKHDYKIQLGKPDSDLYKFNATLIGRESHGLSIDNFLLRGSVVKYTDYVIGCAVRTGHDTKIMKNLIHPPSKLTKFDKDINGLIIFVFSIKIFFVFLMSGMCAYYEDSEKFPLIKDAITSKGQSFLDAFLQYFVLLSYLIPVSLMVSIEAVRLYIMLTISIDIHLFDSKKGGCKPHNSNLSGNLGIVTHVLSDKTGTLTENVMQMRMYADKNGVFSVEDILGNNKAIDDSMELILAFAVCNSVLIYENPRTKLLEYSSDNADESALADFASKCNVRLVKRDPECLVLKVGDRKIAYDIISTIPFTSERKRMTIVLRERNSKEAIVFSKGSDSVMYGLSKDKLYYDQVNNFATAGLRTLVFCIRVLSENETSQWISMYNRATSLVQNREAELYEAAKMIESDMHCIGVSAVEDKLQPYVPEAIYWLRKANIKVWVLTGDKLETAVEIGRTSSIILPDSEVIILSAQDDSSLELQVKNYIRNFHRFRDPIIIFTDFSTDYLLREKSEGILYLLNHSKSAIFSRATPLQKSMITELINSQKKTLTLAIGDGANDVEMIQRSHVGVGLAGNEGSQAAMNSDFAITRFHHLIRLISVHGSWSFDRLTHTAMIMIYKNVIFAFSMTLLVFDNRSSPSSFYDSFFMSCFNLIFTLIPPFCYGWIEQFLSDAQLAKFPQAYNKNINVINLPWIIYFFLNGFYQACVVYFFITRSLPYSPFQEAGVYCFMAAIYTATTQITLWISYWNWINTLAMVVTYLLTLIIMFVYAYIANPEITAVFYEGLWTANVWGALIVTFVTALLPSIIIEYLFYTIKPNIIRLLRESYKKYENAPIHFADSMKEYVKDEDSLGDP